MRFSEIVPEFLQKLPPSSEPWLGNSLQFILVFPLLHLSLHLCKLQPPSPSLRTSSLPLSGNRNPISLSPPRSSARLLRTPAKRASSLENHVKPPSSSLMANEASDIPPSQRAFSLSHTVVSSPPSPMKLATEASSTALNRSCLRLLLTEAVVRSIAPRSSSPFSRCIIYNVSISSFRLEILQEDSLIARHTLSHCSTATCKPHILSPSDSLPELIPLRPSLSLTAWSARPRLALSSFRQKLPPS